ncbi:MAG: polysaccharide biosynthesis/export family protein, partial [Planctomycetota bacterium]
MGLVVDGVIPFRGPDQPPLLPPVQFAENDLRIPPAIGVPVAVQPGGLISLPMGGTVNVDGLTLQEAGEVIGEAYQAAEILKDEAATPIVTLINPRQTTVLVVREDTGQNLAAGQNGGDRQATGGPVSLPAYKNDVLNALMASGGLPGLRAKNEIRIHRRP